MVGVIGFSGRKKSGKTTISQAVAKVLGWRHASFGDFVRNEASRRNLDASSLDVLQDLGQTLIQEGWEDFCRGILTQAEWTSGNGLVVDGIRHVEAVQHLSQIVAPTPFALIHVSTEEDVILQRHTPQDAAKLAQIEEHSTETQVTSTLPSMADLTVDGAAPIDDVVAKIVGFVEGLA